MEKILDAATGLFEKYGFDKVSVDEIAERANTSKATLYKYFESKDNLYLEVLKRVMVYFIDEYEKVIHGSCDFKCKLTQLIKLKIKECRCTKKYDVTNMYQFLNHEQLDKMNKLTDLFHTQGREEGYIDETLSDEDLYDYLEIVIYGIIHKYGYNYSDCINEHKIELIIHLVYDGLLKR
ncbi:TetR/AcrR family transcriptional regulator [Vallitalea pronyensis]|uniref:TetR/AcrR family transcriptional regulator n=1 Tax=Vallitalea pronyensis TaxID=1348613 RepID=A0A8J8MNK8_9FIRM|nr:TetR/AcrR family transcriptional regulator [Vallitalea pronyensis]QUI24741.1 TetR/AcrR family transcriptional regulator [Vallitalea pronyensis]